MILLNVLLHALKNDRPISTFGANNKQFEELFGFNTLKYFPIVSNSQKDKTCEIK